MTAIKRFTRHITGALFTLTLGDVFDWGTSVPEGDRPRYQVPTSESVERVRPALKPNWVKADSYRPTPG